MDDVCNVRCCEYDTPYSSATVIINHQSCPHQSSIMSSSIMSVVVSMTLLTLLPLSSHKAYTNPALCFSANGHLQPCIISLMSTCYLCFQARGCDLNFFSYSSTLCCGGVSSPVLPPTLLSAMQAHPCTPMPSCLDNESAPAPVCASTHFAQCNAGTSMRTNALVP